MADALHEVKLRRTTQGWRASLEGVADSGPDACMTWEGAFDRVAADAWRVISKSQRIPEPTCFWMRSPDAPHYYLSRFFTADGQWHTGIGSTMETSCSTARANVGQHRA